MPKDTIEETKSHTFEDEQIAMEGVYSTTTQPDDKL